VSETCRLEQYTKKYQKKLPLEVGLKPGEDTAFQENEIPTD
jgi:hypothetical protein